ncbi:NirD/YgiW/YdeI family stress tolerance protein (plasmid) [Klebsiella pneumoniae]
MKLSITPLLCCFLLSPALADDNGGLKNDTAPPPAHALDEGYRGTEDARIMTVEQAKTMHDGATISLRGNLIEDQDGDKFGFRDFPSKNDKVLWRPRRLWPPEGYYFFRDPYLGSV